MNLIKQKNIDNINEHAAVRTMLVKDIPEQERPYEKCLKYGPAFLSDAELLAVILRSGNDRENVIDLSSKVLSAYSGRGLTALHRADLNSLMKIRGIGKVKAVQILCIAEISARIVKAERALTTSFASAEETALYYMEDLRHLEYEETVAVFLDTKMRLINDSVIFKGTVNMSMFEPREILSEALKNGAVNLIVLHNHPTGDPTPSSVDISSTVRLKNACNVVGIRLSDHIIIGDNKYVSLHESGVI